MWKFIVSIQAPENELDFQRSLGFPCVFSVHLFTAKAKEAWQQTLGFDNELIKASYTNNLLGLLVDVPLWKIFVKSYIYFYHTLIYILMFIFCSRGVMFSSDVHPVTQQQNSMFSILIALLESENSPLTELLRQPWKLLLFLYMRDKQRKV